MADNYTFPAVVKKHGLTSKKVKVTRIEGDEEDPRVSIDIVEIPCVTITLEFTDERAREINARLSQFQGQEVTIELEGVGRQLNL